MTDDFKRGQDDEFERILTIMYDLLEQSLEFEAEQKQKKLSNIILGIIMMLDRSDEDANL